MDLHFSSLPVLLSLLVFVVFLYKATAWSKRGSNKLPPGPPKFPLIGNLHLFFTSAPPHRVLTDLTHKYGKLMHLQIGGVSTVVVSSPEDAKEVLKTQDITFAHRPSILASEIMGYNNTGLTFSPYGEYWRQLRKVCTLELLSTRRIQSFRPLREKEFLNMCRSIATQQGSQINLTERVEVTICDAFMQASIGKKTEEQGSLISIIKECIDLSAGFSIADVYPSIRVLRLVDGIKGKMERLQRKIDRLLEDIIKDHKMATGDSKQREDLLDVLLKFNEPGHELYLNTDNIKAVILDMFGAGIGTSSTTIDWAMAEMLSNPRVLQKAQDEVRQVFNDKGYVDEADIDKLKYVKSVVKETLRMHVPAPLLLPRENSVACELNGYKLPARTRVMVNAWAIGRDPKYWKDPETFMPERYIDSPIDYKGNNFEYIPFGSGRRVCPAMSFGLALVELPLAMLLYHFDWTLVEKLDMTESFGATIRRKNPLNAIPVLKKPLPAV